MRPIPIRLAAVVLAVAATFAPSAARGEAEGEFTYAADVVWATTVRLLRVDLGYQIPEQDRDNGFLLFVAEENGRTYNGSIEFIPGEGEFGWPTIRLTVSVVGLSSAGEEAILRKLRNKLREQYGQPPRPTRPPAPPPAPEPDDDEDAEPAADAQPPAD